HDVLPANARRIPEGRRCRPRERKGDGDGCNVGRHRRSRGLPPAVTQSNARTRGCRLSATPPTASGAWTSSGASRSRFGATGCSLFEAYRWAANLRILQIEEIKTVPHVPSSHPFVERLIGTVRREFLDQVPFWNACDLER